MDVIGWARTHDLHEVVSLLQSFKRNSRKARRAVRDELGYCQPSSDPPTSELGSLAIVEDMDHGERYIIVDELSQFLLFFCDNKMELPTSFTFETKPDVVIVPEVLRAFIECKTVVFVVSAGISTSSST